VSHQPSVPLDGYTILPSIAETIPLEELRLVLTALLSRAADRGGARAVLHEPLLRSVATGPLRNLVQPYLGPAAFAVRALVFDKTPLANWKVAWHQDVAVSVREYRDCPGWGPWSRKAGTWHVRPPAEVLEGMLTVRLHLDECGPTNGPVRVIPGSHRAGRLSDAQVETRSRAGTPHDCVVPFGGALLMRPLLLHASAPAIAPAHRRVFHVEYAAADLPNGFLWAERWGNGVGAV
jgi:hypothetical protein